MSESRTRFKIKVGVIEVEYEGREQDANQRYKEALEWLKASPQISAQPEINLKKEALEKEETRGGARKSIFSPKIDELIDKGFFKLPNRKKVIDVTKALQEEGLPVTDKEQAILIALKRRLGKNLKGTKTGDEWSFWTE
jgi:hypothetical protein